MTINVVVVDDHTLVREGVARLLQLEDDLAVIGEASSVSDARGLLARTNPDVMLVDVSMPDGSGLGLTRTARAAHPGLGIVVLTMHNDDGTLLEALDAGASALVLKSAAAAEVVDAVRRAAVSPGTFTATGLAAALRRASAPRP
jgi:DNA-binding NarL/FixJ family response regulator